MKSKSQLRLKNIEKDYNEAYDASYIFGDIAWLIKRCKRLEEALESIAHLCVPEANTVEHWLHVQELRGRSCADVVASDTKIAREALEE